MIGIEVRRGELLETESLKSVMEGVNIVVHLAAVMDFYPTADKVEELYKINVGGTVNLLNAFAKYGSRSTASGGNKPRFIYISTTEGFSDPNG